MTPQSSLPPRFVTKVWSVSIAGPALAAGLSVVAGDPRGIAIGLAGVGLIAAPAILPGLRWMPWLVRLVLGLMIGVQFTAEALLLYDRIAPIDKAIHFVETGAMALGLACLVRLVVPGRCIGWVLLVAASSAMGLAASWELIEFGSDVAFGTVLQKGNLDTMTDLLADLAGVTAGTLLSGRFLQTDAGRFLAADFLRTTLRPDLAPTPATPEAAAAPAQVPGASPQAEGVDG